VPATGEKVGAAVGGKLIVYSADATELCVKPGAVAMALMVVVELTAIAPV
jgi:hypothetical protein